MGRVQIDVHRKERPYDILFFSDFKVVKWLIRLRDQIDPYYGDTLDRDYFSAGNVKDLNQEIICTYIYLDELIKMCNFDPIQLKIIKASFEGYSFAQMEKELRLGDQKNLRKRFNTICRKIVEANNYLWKIYTHRFYSNTTFKKCAMCKKELPMHLDFFSLDLSNKDKFRSYCKKCSNSYGKRG